MNDNYRNNEQNDAYGQETSRMNEPLSYQPGYAPMPEHLKPQPTEQPKEQAKADGYPSQPQASTAVQPYYPDAYRQQGQQWPQPGPGRPQQWQRGQSPFPYIFLVPLMVVGAVMLISFIFHFIFPIFLVFFLVSMLGGRGWGRRYGRGGRRW